MPARRLSLMHPVAAAVPRLAALAERPAVRRVARAFEEAGLPLTRLIKLMIVVVVGFTARFVSINFSKF